MHILTFEPNDPIALANELRGQFERGLLSRDEYLAAFRALDRGHSHSQHCSVIGPGGAACRRLAEIILNGKAYCAVHGLERRRQS